MKKFFTTVAIAFIGIAYAQVGVNTTKPKASLEVVSKSGNSGSEVEGVLIPRVNKQKAYLMAIASTKPEESTLIYVNALTYSGASNPKVNEITERGFYYWDGIKWTRSSANITASNGLTKIDTNIELGGALTKNTEVNLGARRLKFSGTGTLEANRVSITDGNLFFKNTAQRLYGDGSSAVYSRSNHSDNTQLILIDKEGKVYGKVLGSDDGDNFGLVDGDGHWSYLAKKDDYTAFKINNSEKMRIKSNGNVGIGTTSPVDKLTVIGDISAEGKLKSSLASNVGGFLELVNPSKTTVDAAQRWKMFNMTGNYGNTLQFWSYRPNGQGTPRMVLTDLGNMGIGVSDPSAKLHVNGTARIVNLPNGNASTDKVVVADEDGNLKKVDASTIGGGTDKSIYTENGTLTGNRTLNLGDSNLSFLLNGDGRMSIGTTYASDDVPLTIVRGIQVIGQGAEVPLLRLSGSPSGSHGTRSMLFLTNTTDTNSRPQDNFVIGVTPNGSEPPVVSFKELNPLGINNEGSDNFASIHAKNIVGEGAIFTGLVNGSVSDKIVTVDAGGRLGKVAATTMGGSNIYSANGTLTGDRVLNLGNHDFHIVDGPVTIGDLPSFENYPLTIKNRMISIGENNEKSVISAMQFSSSSHPNGISLIATRNLSGLDANTIIGVTPAEYNEPAFAHFRRVDRIGEIQGYAGITAGDISSVGKISAKTAKITNLPNGSSSDKVVTIDADGNLKKRGSDSYRCDSSRKNANAILIATSGAFKCVQLENGFYTWLYRGIQIENNGQGKIDNTWRVVMRSTNGPGPAYSGPAEYLPNDYIQDDQPGNWELSIPDGNTDLPDFSIVSTRNYYDN